MKKQFPHSMKLLTTGVMIGMFVTGLLLSPFVSAFPFITKVFAQQEDAEDRPVKNVLLVANEHKVKVAPDNALHPGGIEYAAMTFNGTIPAPSLAVDQGDILNVTIRNDGKTIHSLDFHAGIGPSKVLSGNIAPGDTKSATDQPDLIMTNGMAHKYVPGIGETAKLVLNPNPEIFKVTPGELTRWYILNPGPNQGTSFHFISGMITARDGSNPGGDDYGTQLINDETYWIPPGSASVIESTFPEAGLYVGVDHNMNHVVRGAALAVVAADNSTAKDHPPGTSVAPKGSASTVADWSKQTPYEQLTATKTGDTTSTAGNATSVQSATLAYAQENTVNMPPGSSNPSATEFFVPAEITVPAGSTVTWTNSD